MPCWNLKKRPCYTEDLKLKLIVHLKKKKMARDDKQRFSIRRLHPYKAPIKYIGTGSSSMFQSALKRVLD